jgi:hypothetical protein
MRTDSQIQAASGSKTVAYVVGCVAPDGPIDRFHDPLGVWPMNEFEQTADGSRMPAEEGFSLCPGGKHESANHMGGKKSS